MTQPENPNVQPDSPQPGIQNATPEPVAPQFAGNEPAQQPYGAPTAQTRIDYGAPQNAAPQHGEQPAPGTTVGGVPTSGNPGGPAYGAPTQFPPQGGYDQYPSQGQTDRYSTMTIMGLILAILIPPVGLIISIVAMLGINKHGGSKSSKTFALVGTIVGAVLTVASIALTVSALNSSSIVAAKDDERSPSVTQSQIPDASDSNADDSGITGSDTARNGLTDSDTENDTDSDAGSDDSTPGAGAGQNTNSELIRIQQQVRNGEITLEEAFRNPAVKREMEKEYSQTPTGLKGSISAEGNTLIYTLDVDTAGTGYSAFSKEAIDAAGQLMATQMNRNSKAKFSVRYVILSEGKTLYDKTFTGE